MKAGTFLAAALIFLSLFPLHAERGMKKEKAHVICKDGHRMKILIYSPDSPAEEPSTGVLWIHGGGYITGMASMAGMMGRPPALVKKYGAVVISPEYRLAKKGRYPTAIEDCYEALRFVFENAESLGIAKERIFVGGESAGGGLCAALCILARDRKEFSIAFQMPLYPMIDDRDTESSRDNRNKVWNTKRNHFGWKTYLGPLYGTDDVPSYAAAARETDLSGLPPAYTFVCTGEPFYCETLEFVEKLREAGVEAEVDVYEGLYHAFDMLAPRKEESRKAAENFEKAFRKAEEDLKR
ncbi:MAG: alpha/beta hydrolase [Bacteroidales bacterium]|nr:alpha/beta hydrolase [Bacteroidales bacterium]